MENNSCLLYLLVVGFISALKILLCYLCKQLPNAMEFEECPFALLMTTAARLKPSRIKKNPTEVYF